MSSKSLLEWIATRSPREFWWAVTHEDGVVTQHGSQACHIGLSHSHRDSTTPIVEYHTCVPRQPDSGLIKTTSNLEDHNLVVLGILDEKHSPWREFIQGRTLHYQDGYISGVTIPVTKTVTVNQIAHISFALRMPYEHPDIRDTQVILYRKGINNPAVVIWLAGTYTIFKDHAFATNNRGHYYFNDPPQLGDLRNMVTATYPGKSNTAFSTKYGYRNVNHLFRAPNNKELPPFYELEQLSRKIEAAQKGEKVKEPASFFAKAAIRAATTTNHNKTSLNLMLEATKQYLTQKGIEYNVTKEKDSTCSRRESTSH